MFQTSILDMRKAIWDQLNSRVLRVGPALGRLGGGAHYAYGSCNLQHVSIWQTCELNTSLSSFTFHMTPELTIYTWEWHSATHFFRSLPSNWTNLSYTYGSYNLQHASGNLTDSLSTWIAIPFAIHPWRGCRHCKMAELLFDADGVPKTVVPDIPMHKAYKQLMLSEADQQIPMNAQRLQCERSNSPIYIHLGKFPYVCARWLQSTDFARIRVYSWVAFSASVGLCESASFESQYMEVIACYMGKCVMQHASCIWCNGRSHCNRMSSVLWHCLSWILVMTHGYDTWLWHMVKTHFDCLSGCRICVLDYERLGISIPFVASTLSFSRRHPHLTNENPANGCHPH